MSGFFMSLEEKFMPKFLVILPVSIAGTLIMKGFASALNSCGFLTITKDIREIKPEMLKELEITTILSYDYGFLHNDALTEYLSHNKKEFKLVNYFADDPLSKYANAEDDSLYKQLKNFHPYVFMWDKTYLDMFKKSKYLPLAVDSDLYENDFSFNRYLDITFVGRPLGEKRQKILASLFKIYGKKLKIYSYEKHFIKGAEEMLQKGLLTHAEYERFKDCFVEFLEDEKSLAKIYSHSKINLNITIQGKNNMNYRFFEVLGSCGFLLTDAQECIKDFFEIGTDLETYEDEVDLVDKIDFYLKNGEISQRIAVHGFDRVVNHHTFIDRAREILAIVEHR